MSEEEKSSEAASAATVKETAPPVTSKKAAGSAGAEDGRSERKTRVGVVVSDKMNKTIVVDVVRRVPHPQFKKIIKLTTRFYVHDEKEEAKVGDRVKVMECRPLSKTKRWRLIEILAH